MPIKLSQLAIFCALVEEGTIYAAAEKMHCVPSNITSRIKDLEYAMRVTLFNREQRKLAITPEGRAFYIKAKQLIEMTKQCQDLFTQPQSVGDLNIGALNIVLEKYIHHQTIQFLKDHPEVQINIHCCSSVPLFEKLLSCEFDLIFVDGIVHHPSLSSRVIIPETLYLVSNYNTLAAFKQNAAQQILFSYGNPSVHHILLKSWLELHKIDFQRQCEIESYSLALDAVQQHIGFTVVPSPFLTEAINRHLHCIELHDIASCDISIAWKRSNASRLVQLFREIF
ncbi:DNA-binding transcriptional LysR family regulator [Acinetobacter calcoaceticus]|uniref:DNA-binding transcriptional LysR family regulator n=1 Tax=Acinetobacter calcoaceticus TaxID=471 RepID=A0A4R1Y938_ACICA|nr:DNA-binding transcriptional LysR family regulator [Acinetobacter calcoaceticus]